MGLTFMTAAAEVNLIRNGDFTAGEDHWEKELRGFEMGAENGQSHLSMVRTKRFSDWSDTHTAVQRIQPEQPLEGELKLSFLARVENNNEGYPEIRAELFYPDGSYNRENCFKINAGRDWERKEYLIPRGPMPVVHVRLTLTFRGIGAADFRAFSLEEISVERSAGFETLNVRSGVFGDRGVSVEATFDSVAAFEAVLYADEREVDRHAGEGRMIHWLSPVGTDRPLTLRLTCRPPGGGVETVRELALPPVALPHRPYLWFAADSMVKIMPQQLAANPDDEIALELAANESEAFQIALRREPGADIGKVAVEISDFRDPDGGTILPADAWAYFQIGYIRLDKLVRHPANPYGEPGWWPDALLPVEKLSLPSDDTFAVWCSISVPKGTPAGLYHGSVTLRPEKAPPTVIPVSVEVFPFELPDRPSLPTSYDIDWNDILAVYGPERYPEIRRRYTEYITDRRLSPFPLYARELTPPASVVGLEDRISTMAAGKPVGGHTVDVPATLAEIATWREHIDRVLASPLADRAYFYGFDEFLDPMKDSVRQVFGELKRLYPEISIMTTSTAVDITEEAMRDLHIDWLCVMFDYYDRDKAARVRREAPDLEVWSYISFQPGYPYVNFMLEYPLIDSRICAWQCFSEEIDGFLYWGLNQYWQGGCLDQTRQLIDPEAGPFLSWSKRTGAEGQIFDDLHGDGKILIYGKDGPIGSIVLENIRDGMEDYEYLVLLEKWRGPEAARTLCGELAPSFTDCRRDPALLRELRRRAAREIQAAMK